MGFLKRGEGLEGWHKLAVEMGKVASSSSRRHCFILASGNTGNGEAVGRRLAYRHQDSDAEGFYRWQRLIYFWGVT